MLAIDHIIIDDSITAIDGTYYSEYVECGKTAIDHYALHGSLSFRPRIGPRYIHRARPAYSRSLVRDPERVETFK